VDHPRLSRPSRARGLKPGDAGMGGRPGASRPSRARGLKLRRFLGEDVSGMSVAPFTGAWIETIIPFAVFAKALMSRPSRARGLKLW